MPRKTEKKYNWGIKKVLTSVWLKNPEKYSTFGKLLHTNSEKNTENTPQKTGSWRQNNFFQLWSRGIEKSFRKSVPKSPIDMFLVSDLLTNFLKFSFQDVRTFSTDFLRQNPQKKIAFRMFDPGEILYFSPSVKTKFVTSLSALPPPCLHWCHSLI